MNRPPAQFAHPSFTLIPSNPNPNPNFFHSQPQNTQPAIPTPPLPPPDLSTTISSLDSLVRDSYQTLDSLSALLPLENPNYNNPQSSLIPCPFNPHHRVQPHSLFSHSLHCPSHPHPLPHLNYPKTLKSSDQSQIEKSFLQTLHGSEADLCLSLEHYYADFGSNFFYSDCPGVVNFSGLDGVNRMFTLPLILSVECANFIGRGEREITDFEKAWCRILPSELWAIKTEVESWNEFPFTYSYRVLCAILGLGVVKEYDVGTWIIANSPQYGIVIDVAMRDHIFLLSRLCLKAILREALSKVKEGDPESTHFECPTLVQALMWLASQLSILYGAQNGKLFVINVLKKCLLDAALGSLTFPLEQQVTEYPALEEGSLNLDANGSGVRDAEVMKPLSTDGGGNSMVKENIISRVVFVSQVAAAVAALHERFLLEEKLKAQRVSQTFSRYQRMVDHDYVSQRADEKRKNRGQYRPIIDHDGLPRQQSCNQETNKTKTREELLAEERDYKRRRMSYRGKKVKRTTLQVMRDIIEEYMEEIKQAGGIGCFEKGTEGEGSFPFELPSAPEITTDAEKPTKSNYDSAGCSPSHSRKQSHSSYYAIDSATSKDASAKGSKKLRRSLQGHHHYLEDHRSDSRDRHDMVKHSRSPESRRNPGWAHGQIRHHRERDDLEVRKTKHREISWSSSSISKYRDNRSSSQSNSSENSKVRRDRYTYENHSSNSVVQNTFEDRYDPLISRDIYEEDLSTNRKYARVGRYSENEKSPDYH
ncbi:PREDICTED: U11/U12 small nuclear ribonucleoprotein 48 kDa protein isoform X1 [Prunus mume]|uniref:U11/U12 small nuclear ribonucleoprotein 48 kDa protein isoform X1 n=1 Tax=Prunus mume TaxID=102107 RepID=A0ABM0N245_PRUMU|nr:PREDICTED: U11/U12 small nuclear ribonucleoprotein 48 kDa protein isoform X1 [Prunus mume]XP_016646800.1 PREDICTED: U11/U12 small nuclear ribonucleoprotein 48 kDa protein isoform X1 [Prunus mume]